MRVRRRWICSVWLRRPYPVAPGQEGYPDDIQVRPLLLSSWISSSSLPWDEMYVPASRTQQLDSMHSEEDEDTQPWIFSSTHSRKKCATSRLPSLFDSILQECMRVPHTLLLCWCSCWAAGDLNTPMDAASLQLTTHLHQLDVGRGGVRLLSRDDA